MYIHIGGEYSIPAKTILGVFDLDGITSGSGDSLLFLKRAEADGRIESVSYDIPRSVIVTLEKVYISPISPRTLRKRIRFWEEYGEANTTKDGMDHD